MIPAPPEGLRLVPIGYVATDVADEEIPRRRRDIVSRIILLPEYAPGLAGLDAYSHLIVLFYMHRAPPCTSLVSPARSDPPRPAVGTFALRTRNRPNPLGLAVVDLIEVAGNELTVRRLDAWHGTPVVDLKPYDYYDIHSPLRVPAWSNSARARGAQGSGDTVK